MQGTKKDITMATIRKAYWSKAKDLLEYCSMDELKFLSTQATKELDKRMNAYLGKVDSQEHEKGLIKKARKKIKARRHSKSINTKETT